MINFTAPKKTIKTALKPSVSISKSLKKTLITPFRSTSLKKSIRSSSIKSNLSIRPLSIVRKDSIVKNSGIGRTNSLVKDVMAIKNVKTEAITRKASIVIGSKSKN